MAKPITWWKWEGQALTPVTKEDRADTAKFIADPLKVTTYSLEQLRVCKEGRVRDWIEEDSDIIRLIEPMRYRDSNGNRIVAQIKLDRTQQRHAVAAYIFLENKNIRTCKTCKNPRNEGPFAKCVSFGADVFKGACSSCQYSSQAHNCEFHESKRGSQFAETGDEPAPAVTWPVFTDKLLRNASRRQLQLTIAQLMGEVLRRDQDELAVIGAPLTTANQPSAQTAVTPSQSAAARAEKRTRVCR